MELLDFMVLYLNASPAVQRQVEKILEEDRLLREHSDQQQNTSQIGT